ncbi:Uncharacterised protein [Vibrio cholerae]|nr:Uncharacterised protein [Vibrio cholerae]
MLRNGNHIAALLRRFHGSFKNKFVRSWALAGAVQSHQTAKV